MLRFTTIISNFLIFGLLLSGIWILESKPFYASAQQAPEFLITWVADNYVPPEYQGKILPIGNSTVNASLELISSGKLINLSSYEVRWFLNDEPLVSGLGIKNANFTVDPFSGRAFSELRAEIIDYRGQDLKKTIDIPTTILKTTIIRTNNISFKALPYFFNTLTLSQLTFGWSVNNIETEGIVENPNMLSINFTGPKLEDTINVALTVQNQKNLSEIVGKFMNFQIKHEKK